jgi:hypothetical protein
MFFYELHEGDDEVYSDVLLYSDSEWEPDEFFDLVQSVRRRVQGAHEHDTLIEAIAAELERQHGFVYISDERLGAVVNVSAQEDDNFLLEADEDEDDVDDDEDEDTDDGALRGGYRTIVADVDTSGLDRPN